jgi:hypothetical protein
MSESKKIESKWLYAVTPEIRSALAEHAEDGRITCEVARRIAEEFDVPYPVIGTAADLVEIRIKNCSLGCF